MRLFEKLHRMEPSPEALWLEAQKHVSCVTGILVIDDSTLDKWYAKKIELVTRRSLAKLASGLVSMEGWVQGINLQSAAMDSRGLSHSFGLPLVREVA